MRRRNCFHYSAAIVGIACLCTGRLDRDEPVELPAACAARLAHDQLLEALGLLILYRILFGVSGRVAPPLLEPSHGRFGERPEARGGSADAPKWGFGPGKQTPV
jgi:hypothetical protein